MDMKTVFTNVDGVYMCKQKPECQKRKEKENEEIGGAGDRKVEQKKKGSRDRRKRKSKEDEECGGEREKNTK